MQFSRLRLVGFKSFADAAELVIAPGLTGIVGPNGCGKSNLAEALRWVMGESSYKAMRAARGEEVIFAGAASGRPAANFAEVALYLDNSDFSAPLGYNNEAELRISRHITRDGISQYRINGREARAKDVQFLLADQAAGAHSPAQVGQGRVGALIEAKPQARRILLEEAAGIGGLQMRREEAESKLKATDANLARAGEILADLEARLAALRAQAHDAAEFRAFSSAIRRLELLSHRLKLRETGAARQAAETALNKQTALLAEKHEQQLRLAAAAEEKRAAAEAAEQKRAAAAAAGQRLALEDKALEREQRLRADNARNLAENLKQLDADIAREQQQLEENKAIKRQWEAELAAPAPQAAPPEAERQEALAKAELEAAERVFSAAREKRAQAAAALEARQKAAQFYAEMRARQDKKQAELEAKLKAAAQASALTAEDGGKAAAQAARAEYAAQEKRCAAAQALYTARAEGQKAAAAAAEQSARAEHAAAAKLAALQAVIAEFSAEQQAQTGGAAAAVSLCKVQKGCEAAFAAALGEAANAALNPASPLYWRALPPMAENLPLPQGVKPLAECAAAPAALARILSQTGIMPDLRRGQELQTKLRQGQVLVSLGGDILRWDGFSKKAGHEADIYGGYLKRRRQAEELSEALAEAARAHEAARGLLAARAADYAEAERALQAQRLRLAAAGEKREAAEAKARAASAEHKAAAAEQSRLGQMLAELQAEREAPGQNYAAGAAAEAEDISALEQAERQAEAAYKAARDSWLAQRAEAEARETQRQAKAARQEKLQRDLALWQMREEKQQAYLAELGRRRAEASQARAAAESAAKRQEQQRQALLSAAAEAENALRAAAESAAQAAQAGQMAAQSAYKAEQALFAAREGRSRCEEKLAAAEERACRAEEAAAAYLGRSLQAEDMEEELGAITEQEIERQLRQKRGQRAALGAVNLRAGEESAALQSRYETLKAETEDIAAAQAKLREAIADLNREGRARLRQAFAEVNARFAHLFQRLFSGGAAELQWVEDAADPLNIGLEIAVCPPGKKRQNISLLSGGEQCLTALALIFAVFLSNPAPLCLLDEVDAPLDDYNVERFCRLLREMTQRTKTRFLVISHNPISMAQMDRLFGVTMIEKGVSALVSVDLNEAAAAAAAAETA